MLTLTRPRIAAQPSVTAVTTMTTVSDASLCPDRRPAHPDDAAGLADLEARGHDRLTLRWTHHLLAPDEAAATRTAARLEALGWTVGLRTAMPAPFPGWRLRVHRHAVVDATALDAGRTALTTVAAATGACYDGWDARPPTTEEQRP